MAQGLIEYSNVSDLVIDYDPAGHWHCKTSSQTLPFFAICLSAHTNAFQSQ
jgi:hypothetical protein